MNQSMLGKGKRSKRYIFKRHHIYIKPSIEHLINVCVDDISLEMANNMTLTEEEEFIIEIITKYLKYLVV